MKKFISSILALTLMFSSMQVFADTTIPLKDVDPDFKQEIYKADKNEKIIGSMITYPSLAILSNKEGHSYIYYSEDYGKTLENIDLTEELDGFTAAGIIWDNEIYPGYIVYGGKNGMLAMYHSADFRSWSPIYWEKNIEGTIMNVNISGYGCDIYFTDGKRNYVLNTYSIAGKIADEPVEFKNKLPLIFAGYADYGFYTDGNVLYKTSDNKNYDMIKLENVKEIFDLRVQKVACSDMAICISYIDNKNQVIQKRIVIKPMEEPNWIPEDIPEDSKIDFENFGRNVIFSGSWGYPMLVTNEKSGYIVYLKRDAKRLTCDKRNVAWLNQYADPDIWAYEDVVYMAEKNVLTPRTTPEDYTANISRQLFGEYVYNLIAGKKNIITDKVVFSDTDDPYINSLADIDVVKGDNGKFSPDDMLTREQAAAILTRILRYFGTGTNGDKTYTINDDKDISSWAKDDVDFLYGYGIFTGDNLGNFNPKKNMTIQEALITMRRIERMINTSEYCELCG